MATYKVLQDIEAEDKLLGPLSLRQFIYAVIVVVLGFIMFKTAMVQPLLAIPFLPPAILFAILAAPFGHDQSSEIWLLAKIRFFLKPRRRVWNQSGLQELVKITAPKKVEQVLTNGLDQGQVKSRLEALAQTIDTRGWVIKGVNSNMYTAPSLAAEGSDDRLLNPTFSAPAVDDTAADDILDAQNNPRAQQMDQMVRANDQSHRQALLEKMDRIRNGQEPAPASAPAVEPAVNSAPAPAQAAAAPVQPTTPPMAAAANQAGQASQAIPPLPNLPAPAPKAASYGKTPVLQPDTNPGSAVSAPAELQNPAPEAMTTAAKPVILNLASNDDLSVAAIARQANKATRGEDGEVVISLH